MAISLAEVRRIADQHLVKDMERMNAVRLAPRPDNGFYGPETITWRMTDRPLCLMAGILRGAIEVLFDPKVAAATNGHSVMHYDPLTRARRSIMFFQMATFGDGESAIAAGRTLFRVHSHINGIDPVTGGRYDGTDLEMALWTHALGLVAISDCYDQFGRGLSKTEKDQFVAENWPFAQLVGIAPENIPTTMDQCRDIALGWMPRMALGVYGVRDVDFLLRSPMTPAWPMAVAGPVLRVAARAFARRLTPDLLELARFHPSRVSIRLAEVAIRAAVLATSGTNTRKALTVVSPEGMGMMLQALEADPHLPLADPKLREDLHLVVRRPGVGNKYSDFEHSPFVHDQAHSYDLERHDTDARNRESAHA
ncbi:oxygenase MpaB family protein [Mycobacterium hubeiense]|uniref:oxygenase MpaB family protein n=1 Tax=Mycobacterium hubeiense TaxID=1867256 RepID=UPI000C7EC6D9|nr:oxygenase MpaB family protein [Mycobacterium sp. QGD 101]